MGTHSETPNNEDILKGLFDSDIYAINFDLADAKKVDNFLELYVFPCPSCKSELVLIDWESGREEIVYQCISCKHIHIAIDTSIK